MPPFILDREEMKPGLVLFRRSDVNHNNWYCRMKIPGEDRYKTVSLKTPDISVARERAFDAAADLRFRLKHDVPVFHKPFSHVAQEFSDYHKARAEAGQISHKRWRVIDAHIRHLNDYIGSVQISLASREKWNAYPLWRKQNGRSRARNADDKYDPPSDGSIRNEIKTFRAIMRLAAERNYIRDNQVPGGRLDLQKERRDAFTPAEYRKLHRYARKWIRKAASERYHWYRTMADHFILVMADTGMRPSEARNLRWRDVSEHVDRQGRRFVSLAVSGKGKRRELVAANNVLAYLERIRAHSRATQADDHVFTTIDGESTQTLYSSLIKGLLADSWRSRWVPRCI